MSNKLVNFGKYKEQPIEVLLDDTEYTQWLMQQEWIQERYLWIYNAIKSTMATEDTPEHNEMQSRFLDEDYCKNIAILYSNKTNSILFDKDIVEQNIDTNHDIIIGDTNLTNYAFELIKNHKADKKFHLQKIIKLFENYHYLFLETTTNEKVGITLNIINNQISRMIIKDHYNYISKEVNLSECYHAIFELNNIDVQYIIPFCEESKNLKIELKPSISDNFMNILRKAKQQDIDLVLCDTFSSKSVTFENVVKMFLTRDVILAKTADVINKNIKNLKSLGSGCNY